MADEQDAEDGGGYAIEVDRRTLLKAGGAAGAAGIAGIGGYVGAHILRDGPQAEAEVAMVTDYPEHTSFYQPQIVWVEEGGTVTWHNESGVHNATAYHPANDRPMRMPEGVEAWDSPIGEDYTRTFEEEGVYDYFCEPHEPMGMVGTVIVGHPDPEQEPGLSEPGEELYRAAREELRVLNGQVVEKLEQTDR